MKTSHCVHPCPCGYHPSWRCTEGMVQVQSYQKRISGPLIDCIDIHLEVASVEVEKLAGLAPGESSRMGVSSRADVEPDDCRHGGEQTCEANVMQFLFPDWAIHDVPSAQGMRQ